MATATNTATVEQSEQQGVRLVRLNGSLSQKGVADVSSSFVAAVCGNAGSGGGGPVAGSNAQAGETVVVDLSGVDVIATTGITLLLVADRDLRKSGGKMVLAGTRGLVRDVLLRCRLDKVLTLASTAADAVASARRDA